MAAAPFKILDQFGRNAGSSNLLHEAASPGRDRPAPPRVDKDSRQNLSQFGYRQLLAAGRVIYANCSPLKNAIDIMAELAIGNAYLPQYFGRNKAWGDRAESLLTEWHKIMDVRGGVFDWQTNLKIWVKSIKRDGDVGILLTEASGGYPQVQTIPGHRIGSWGQEAWTVQDDGPYKGMDLRNGVISNDYARPMAYRVYDSFFTKYRDISASTVLDAAGAVVRSADMRVWYRPDWCDQARGLSAVAAGVNDWGDRKQSMEFVKAALKKEASYAVVEYTESGQVDAAEQFARTGPQNEDFRAAIYEERVEGGLTQIYKANSGSKVEFPSGKRPSAESEEFWLKITRDAFQAIGWPMEFYDSGRKGGAALRLIMELAQPHIEADQALAQKIATWIDGWRLAKAIQMGELPPDPDWWMIAHQSPMEITADKGYSAQIDREDFKIGFTSFKDVCARRGQWWEDVRDQQTAEVEDLCRRAAELSDGNDYLTFEMALNLLQQRTANIPSSANVSEKITESDPYVDPAEDRNEPRNKKKQQEEEDNEE